MTRPLPEVTAQNEFFWSAGADGVLLVRLGAGIGVVALTNGHRGEGDGRPVVRATSRFDVIS